MANYTKPAFDKEKVIRKFISLLPETHPARNKEDTVTTITTYWRKGELTRIEINGTDWTSYISKAKQKIEEILKMSNRFKRKYTGVIALLATKKKGSIETLKFEERNTIFRG